MVGGIDLQLVAVVAGLIISILLLGYLLFLEIRARRRYTQLEQVERLISETVKPEKIKYAEFLGIPAGSAGLSIYNVYAATNNHDEVLNALSYRFNNKLAGVDHPFEWLNYLLQKTILGEDVVEGVVKNIMGQLGEEQAVEFLNSLPEFQATGLSAELFKSRSHPDNDIIFKDKDGNVVDPSIDFFRNSEVSVKTFSKESDFLKVVRKSNAVQYLVNNELYNQLVQSGKLQELNDSGITVRNGRWSIEEFKNMSNDTFEDFADAGDAASDVPLVAFLFMGYRTFGNSKKLYHGSITKEEFGKDFMVDGARATTAGIAGLAGGKAGMVAGSMIAPGIGTFIGGGLGMVAGALGSSYFFKRFKDWFKYRKLKAYLSELADYYYGVYVHNQDIRQKSLVIDQMSEKYFGVENTKSAIKEESRLMSYYSDENNLYASRKYYKEPTIMGALTKKHLMKLDAHYQSARYSCQQVFSSLWVFCNQKMDHKVDKTKLLFASILVDFDLTQKCSLPAFKLYMNEIKKYPNNPFRVYGTDGVINGQSIVESNLYDRYQNTYKEKSKRLVGKFYIAIFMLTLISITLILILIGVINF